MPQTPSTKQKFGALRSTAMKRLLVIQHVPHERLGTFESAFTQAGCELVILNADDPKAAWSCLGEVDGIVSMGGPQSVCDGPKYPFIAKELKLLREAVAADLPVLGVCLGAQMLAAALGAKVTKALHKEIGWHPVMRSPWPVGHARHSATRDAPASLHEPCATEDDPLFSIFGQTETVFQWHGDTFALPKGAVRLASSSLCDEQAFRYRDRVYGLQFHLEVTEPIIRAWMRTAVNKAELASLRGTIDPMTIRRQSPQHVDRLQELSRHVASQFCVLIDKPTTRATQKDSHACHC